MTICPKIDVHAHAVRFAAYEYPVGLNVTPELLLKTYDKLGVERGLLLPITSPEATNIIMTNGGVCDLAKTYPDRFWWSCNVDPRALSNTADAALYDMLKFYKELGAVGMGELTANLPVDDKRMENLFASCAALHLPVTIHIGPQAGGCYGIIDEVGLPKLEKMLKKYPDLTVLGHSQPFWAEIGANCTQENRNSYPTGAAGGGNLTRLLRECPNLCCDMSAGSGFNAMSRDFDHAYRFIEEFGDRMLYAIDLCSEAQAAGFAAKMVAWLDESAANGSISEAHYRGICRENAIRLFGKE